MFIQKKDYSIKCTDCDEYVMKLKDYEMMKNRNNPDWFWEPYNYEENYLYICPKCKRQDFISDSEF